MKIAVIGGGIFGVTTALTLAQKYPVQLFEKNSDILLIATHGDKCDTISQQYYGTPNFWWFIASVNNLKSNNIEAGTQLRIPISVEEASLK